MTRIVALHGFLGQSKDWNEVSVELKRLSPDCDFQTVNLYSPQLIRAKSLKEWAKKFNQIQKNKHVERNILVGYSLGGRLALHAAIDKPGLWDSVVLVSAHPGLTDFDDVQKRMMSDQNWADKFTKLPWEEVVHLWNDQSVFEGSVEPSRQEMDYDRSHLTHMIKNWSLAQHDIIGEALVDLKPKLNWYAGDKDAQYAQIFQNLQEQGLIENIHTIENAGHRVIFDSPKELSRQLVSQLNL